MRARAIALTLLVACSCGGGTDPDTSADADTDVDSDTDADADTDADYTCVEDETADLYGVAMEGPSGEPLPGATVQVCLHDCRSCTTGPTGSFSFVGLSEATYSFELKPPHDRPYLVPSAPIPVVPGLAAGLEAFWFHPDRTTPVPATAAELEILEGAHLTIGLDTADPPPFFDLVDLYAARVADSAHFLPVDGTAVWMVHLGPFDTQSTDGGFSLRFSDDQGLTGGRSYTLLASVYDYNDGEPLVLWRDLGTFRVDGGVLTGSAALDHLSTLALVEVR